MRIVQMVWDRGQHWAGFYCTGISWAHLWIMSPLSQFHSCRFLCTSKTPNLSVVFYPAFMKFSLPPPHPLGDRGFRKGVVGCQPCKSPRDKALVWCSFGWLI